MSHRPLLLLALSSLAAGSVGCFDVFPTLTLFRQTGQDGIVGAGGTGGTGGAGGTGGTGGGGGTPVECVPSEDNPQVAEDCGAFVSPLGSDVEGEGDGTKAKPYRTLGKAAGARSRVYACAEEGSPFEEALEPVEDVTFFGGLECGGWAYDPTKKSGWTAAADSVPLVVGSGVTVSVFDFVITARDAEKDGGSSIGVIASGTGELAMERCEVVAGDGKAGVTPMKPAGSGTPGMAGEPGQDGCVDAVNKFGGNPGQNTCDEVSYNGGLGGNGTAIDGGPGSDGQPQPGPMPLDGKGGAAQIGANQCKAGEPGAQGIAGDPGDGATGIGLLTESGYGGTSGGPGKKAGTPGQGGGGGGGAKQCQTMSFAGPGGGGGGAGGCGGLPGNGGGPGGASIGILSAGATVTLSDVTIQTGTGGTGGVGSDGQLGGKGGDGGQAGSEGSDAAADACDGGKGGKGGDGGPGGGGLGGHSLGIAFTGPAPTTNNVTVNLGTAGDGGDGGAMTMVATAKGAAGLACQSLSFDDGADSCVP